MNTQNFQNLIQLVTGRDFLIDTTDESLATEKEYFVYRILPITNRKIYFKWVTPKTDEKMLKSFITAFTTRYKEPNPRAYDWSARTYGEKAKWENKTEEEREFAYYHHSSNMYSKKELLEQIEANFGKEDIANGLIRYGFYPTEYGVGIFCFWATDAVKKAINTMAEYLKNKSIPYSNEFSDARWVFRFKLGISKEAHTNILNQLTNN